LGQANKGAGAGQKKWLGEAPYYNGRTESAPERDVNKK